MKFNSECFNLHMLNDSKVDWNDHYSCPANLNEGGDDEDGQSQAPSPDNENLTPAEIENVIELIND